MENKETFQMTYSAERQAEIQAIRKKYLPREEDKLAQLRALDAAVERKATGISIAVGVMGTLLLGTGMSLTMTDFGASFGRAAFLAGILVGIAGIGVIALAYPLYVRTLKKEREKIAPEILKLTDALMQ